MLWTENPEDKEEIDRVIKIIEDYIETDVHKCLDKILEEVKSLIY